MNVLGVAAATGLVVVVHVLVVEIVDDGELGVEVAGDHLVELVIADEHSRVIGC